MAYKRYCKCPNRARYQEHVKEQKEYKKLIRSQKINFERKLFEDVKTNTRAFQKYAGRKTKAKATITNVKREDSTLFETAAETAEQLMKFFVSVYQKESNEDILIASDFRQLVREDRVDILKYIGILKEGTIEEFSVSWRVVDELLIKSNEYKAVDLDNVHPFIQKSLVGVLSEPFEIIFKKS